MSASICLRLHLPDLAATGKVDSPIDLVVSYDDGASAAALVDAVAKLLRERASHPVPDATALLKDYELYSRKHQGFLNPLVPLGEAGLIRGDELELRTHPTTEPDAGIIMNEFLAEQEAVSFGIVDLEGRHAGRVTRVPPEVTVGIGSHPSVPDTEFDIRLPVESPSLPQDAISLTADTHGDITLDVVGSTRVIVNGRTTTKYGKLPKGSVIALDEGVRFLVAPCHDVDAVNPFAQVPFAPSARVVPAAVEAKSLTPPRKPIDKSVPTSISSLLTRFATPVISALLMAAVLHNSSLVVLAAVPIVAGFLEWIWSGRKHRREAMEAHQAYETAQERFLKQVKAAVATEREVRINQAPTLDVLIDRAIHRRPEMWSRRVEHSDFLVISLGTSSTQALVSVTHQNEEQEQATRHDIAADRQLARVPALVSLKDDHIAIVGATDKVLAFLWSVMVQLVVEHSPGDVKVVIGIPDNTEHLRALDWMCWLPHLQTKAPDHPAMFTDRTNLEAELIRHAGIYEITDSRAIETLPYLVVVLHEALQLDKSLLERLLRSSRDRVRVIWIGHRRGGVPGFANLVLEVDETSPTADVVVSSRTFPFASVESELRMPGDGASIALAMAPLYDARSRTASSGIPAVCELSRVLGDSSSWAEVVERNRNSSSAQDELEMRLGLCEAGTMTLDLVADGPHLLIGGTTGSGKSELLQTMIASLAWKYSPADVNFLLFDFKGGATFQPFEKLPHTIGFVTNLDRLQMERALVFLLAELDRRMELFDELARQKDQPVESLSAYRELSGRDDTPRLVIAFDEFASLVHDHPKYMEMVITVAQRGRSLGVHLVLATQRPAGGTVSADVRANVAARIALRTLDPDDSQVILDSPRAAFIPADLAGRAFIRLDSQRLIEFQSGYASSNVLSSRRQGDGSSSVRLQPFGVQGAAPVAGSGAAKSSRNLPSDLTLLVNAVGDAKGSHMSSKQPILKPSLRDNLAWYSDGRTNHTEPFNVMLGRCDDPAGQKQFDYPIDLSRGPLLAFGGIGSGKSNLLAVTARQLAFQCPELKVVGIDAGDGSLADALGHAAQCEWLIPGSDLASSTLLLDQLLRLIEMRDPADQSVPPTLLLIDELGTYCGPFDANTGRIVVRDGGTWLLKLAEVFTQGRNNGIYSAATIRRPGELPYALRGVFRHTMQLSTHRSSANGCRCASTLFEHC